MKIWKINSCFLPNDSVYIQIMEILNFTGNNNNSNLQKQHLPNI